jgi:hypothetical protein
VAFSAGGDGGRRSPELLAALYPHTSFAAAIVIVVTIKLTSRHAASKSGDEKKGAAVAPRLFV